MQEFPINEDLAGKIQKLKEKYDAMGQDLSSYLDGLLYADYLTYWEYIHLDTLLSLQHPKTSFPDEHVFIMYHQITELYFKLILHELNQIALMAPPSADEFLKSVRRLIRYFQHLAHSFDIMTEGMDRDQFLKFRMALLPSSGFQSAQYRLIEICSTNLVNLVSADERHDLDASNIKAAIEKLYWRQGATELGTGKKTLTLQQFEKKYMELFADTATAFHDKNLYQLYKTHFANGSHPDVTQALRELDTLANIHWRMAHLKSAGRYLQKDPEDIKATGGTNWQKYLPPRFQRIMFFPELWSDEEKENWGRAAFVPTASQSFSGH